MLMIAGIVGVRTRTPLGAWCMESSEANPATSEGMVAAARLRAKDRASRPASEAMVAAAHDRVRAMGTPSEISDRGSTSTYPKPAPPRPVISEIPSAQSPTRSERADPSRSATRPPSPVDLPSRRTKRGGVLAGIAMLGLVAFVVASISEWFATSDSEQPEPSTTVAAAAPAEAVAPAITTGSTSRPSGELHGVRSSGPTSPLDTW